MATCTVPGPFYGMDTDALAAGLAQAQAAYIALLAGSKEESVSYTQGEGARAVTFTRTNIANLTALIAQLQAALGQGCGARRRPITFRFQ